MTKSTQTNGRQQPGRATEFYIWLASNSIQIGILCVLLAGGIITFLMKDIVWRKEVPKASVPVWTDKDWQGTRYGQSDCVNDRHCRQLKRIYAEGGQSPEALRKNLLEADKTLTFEQLQENAARYEGTPWAFEGKIIDILWQDNRGKGDYILADVIIGEDPEKQLSVRGDFTTNLVENDYVYVVGYITGTSHPRLGPNPKHYKGNVPSLSARALLKPSEAKDLLQGTGTNR
jgi:hypothetical protein